MPNVYVYRSILEPKNLMSMTGTVFFGGEGGAVGKKNSRRSE